LDFCIGLGAKTMNCKICGRNLKNPKAIAKGIGAVCERKLKEGNNENQNSSGQ
jgi:hypothetical protein